MEETEKRHLADLYNDLVTAKHEHQKAIDSIDMRLDIIREKLGISVRVSMIIEV